MLITGEATLKKGKGKWKINLFRKGAPAASGRAKHFGIATAFGLAMTGG